MVDLSTPSTGPRLALRGARADAPLSERVYTVLREAITEGAFDGDAQLIQESIAEELAISRTPVREALYRLASEGYVRQSAGRGFFVEAPSPSELAEIYQIRADLEPFALRLGFDRFTTSDLDTLRALQRATYDPEWARAQYNESNRRFHFALCEPCPNRTLVGLIHALWDRPAMQLLTRHRAATLRNPEDWRDEHGPLIEAIASGERERAVQLLARHLAVSPADMN
jgi:DNA-binding GntR family transcriptional regulator